MTPKVYFTDFCSTNGETLPQKLARLIMTAGIDQIDFHISIVEVHGNPLQKVTVTRILS